MWWQQLKRGGAPLSAPLVQAQRGVGRETNRHQQQQKEVQVAGQPAGDPAGEGGHHTQGDLRGEIFLLHKESPCCGTIFL